MAGPWRYDIVFWQGEDDVKCFRVLLSCEPAPPFAASTQYLVGDYCRKVADDGSLFLVVGAGTAAAAAPRPTGTGGRVASGAATFMRVDAQRLLDTTGYAANFAARDEPGGTDFMDGSTANARVQVGFDPPKWAAGTTYGAGQQAV